MKNREIKIFEHDTLRIGNDDNELRESEFESLCRFYEDVDKRYYFLERRKIKFKHYVGVLQVGSLTIEVLPKVDKNQIDTDKWHDVLVKILKYTQKVRSYSTTDSSLSYSKQSLLDLYFEQFMHEVEILLKEGLRKKYRHKEGNLNKLKGRIVFNEHLKKNPVHKNKLYCSFQTYDFDHDIHTAIKMALDITKNVVRNPGLNAKAKRLKLLLPDEVKSNITLSRLRNIHLDRTTKRYEKTLNLAELIIKSYCPVFSAGRISVLAFMFDMNHLFEEFVLKVMKSAFVNKNVKVGKRQTQFWQQKLIKPDIVIEGYGNTIVLDTKWKIPENRTPSDSDLKQIFAYNHFFDSPISFLLYPSSSVFNNTDLEQKNDFFHRDIRINGNDSGNFCKLAVINFFKNDIFDVDIIKLQLLEIFEKVS